MDFAQQLLPKKVFPHGTAEAAAEANNGGDTHFRGVTHYASCAIIVVVVKPLNRTRGLDDTKSPYCTVTWDMGQL